jgi:hypothetical protein
MAARIAPPPELLPMYRVLYTLENARDGGFYWPGDIVQADQLSAESISILMERGIIMPHLDPAHIAALPEYA